MKWTNDTQTHKTPHQAPVNMATDENVTNSLWEDFFLGLVYLLDIPKFEC